ncbi:MAG TPA: protein kinase [Polyangiaceae bacterium]
MNAATKGPTIVIGRYALFDEIAAGGMASVHYGRLLGEEGFTRTVAIKRLHPHLARDPEFATMFLDEARVAARIRHPNVVPTLDVVNLAGELFIVMEYVQGESLARLNRAGHQMGSPMPAPVAAAIMVGVLHGLHAAHEATNERGEPLHIVHRDVSPQNILVGLDGIPRLVDFGVAKAAGRAHSTREGQLKGKIAYMAPEQIRAEISSPLVDVYASAVVFWELLTCSRLFTADNDVTTLDRVLHMDVRAPSAIVPSSPAALDTIVLRALDRDPEKRFTSAREMARAIEDATPLASISRVGEWVGSVAGALIAERAAKVAEIESHSEIRVATPSRRSSMPQPRSRPLVAEPAPAPAESTQVDVVARPTPSPSGARGRLVGLLAALTVCAVGAITLGVLLAHRGTERAPAPPAPVSTAAAEHETAAAPPPRPVEPIVTATATASAPPIEILTAKPEPPPPTATFVAPPPTPTHAATHKTTHDSKCSPPYYVDDAGVTRYKLDCL